MSLKQPQTEPSSTVTDTATKPAEPSQSAISATGVNFTLAAATKVQQLIAEEGDPTLMLRVSIQGGGCSGFQYGFDFTDQQQADDMVICKTITWPPLVQTKTNEQTPINDAPSHSGNAEQTESCNTANATDANKLEAAHSPATATNTRVAITDLETTAADSGTTTDAQVTVTLLIDPLSIQYLRGASIDYCEDVHGAQFVISNPNAKTTCGCGSSFSA